MTYPCTRSSSQVGQSERARGRKGFFWKANYRALTSEQGPCGVRAFKTAANHIGSFFWQPHAHRRARVTGTRYTLLQP